MYSRNFRCIERLLFLDLDHLDNTNFSGSFVKMIGPAPAARRIERIDGALANGRNSLACLSSIRRGAQRERAADDRDVIRLELRVLRTVAKRDVKPVHFPRQHPNVDIPRWVRLWQVTNAMQGLGERVAGVDEHSLLENASLATIRKRRKSRRRLQLTVFYGDCGSRTG
jgi:hypothetical protein